MQMNSTNTAEYKIRLIELRDLLFRIGDNRTTAQNMMFTQVTNELNSIWEAEFAKRSIQMTDEQVTEYVDYLFEVSIKYFHCKLCCMTYELETLLEEDRIDGEQYIRIAELIIERDSLPNICEEGNVDWSFD